MKQTKKNYDEMTLEELMTEHIRLIDWADDAKTDRQAEKRLQKLDEFETYYRYRLRLEALTDEG